MKNRIAQLIEDLLSEARPAIEDGGTCASMALILHPGGVKSCVFCRKRSDESEWTQIEGKINTMLEKLDSDVAILLKDIPTGEETSDHSASRSMENPFLDRDGALTVTVWSRYGFGATGRQRYLRCADGTVLFGKFQLDNHNPPALGTRSGR